MKMPQKLKIGGHIYKIVYRDRLNNDGTENLGTHDAKNLTIWIDKTLSQSQQEATLIHEIIEAINYGNQLKLTHEQISTLEHNFYQVLKDNFLLK